MNQLTALAGALRIVDEQAEDEGLWFTAVTAPEAYLQQELRALHKVVEALTPLEAALSAADEKMPVVAGVLHHRDSRTTLHTAAEFPFAYRDTCVGEAKLVRQSDAQAAVLAAYEAGKAAANCNPPIAP